MFYLLDMVLKYVQYLFDENGAVKNFGYQKGTQELTTF